MWLIACTSIDPGKAATTFRDFRMARSDEEGATLETIQNSQEPDRCPRLCAEPISSKRDSAVVTSLCSITSARVFTWTYILPSGRINSTSSSRSTATALKPLVRRNKHATAKRCWYSHPRWIASIRRNCPGLRTECESKFESYHSRQFGSGMWPAITRHVSRTHAEDGALVVLGARPPLVEFAAHVGFVNFHGAGEHPPSR